MIFVVVVFRGFDVNIDVDWFVTSTSACSLCVNNSTSRSVINKKRQNSS